MGDQDFIILFVVVLVVLYLLSKQGALSAEGITAAGQQTTGVLTALAKMPAAAVQKLTAAVKPEHFIAPNPVGRAYATVIPGARTRVASQFAI